MHSKYRKKIQTGGREHEPIVSLEFIGIPSFLQSISQFYKIMNRLV